MLNTLLPIYLKIVHTPDMIYIFFFDQRYDLYREYNFSKFDKVMIIQIRKILVPQVIISQKIDIIIQKERLKRGKIK